ncbi:hypothetical protein WT10_02780 [Burkholderia stagnalis]|uniref:hypothetical protein n=1 Tax=Burkholderia stagnalis TaxID=1503054 RepID=UPI0007548AFA|nr:hypothetical protein [Burkholderia stagnalis]KVC67353.1 hypothetical protein WS59_09960 [Burkholderia stagnalis]KVN21509.1 hypothetical protein WT10_02780 [Burkholderia stagnalis]KWI75696.1 hypothetical protein WT75_06185 [Burkholderia stagnalis]KWN17248.1 hypothetical protein WT84_18495 [Burkholderia stagnalis]KWN23283.1 hypothetical protein WT85_30105 [Burkholderia stagnalis]
MRIEMQDEEDLKQALAEIHRRASAYEGPLMQEFRVLAVLSAPVEVDEPLGKQSEDGVSGMGDAGAAGRNETKERFEEALSLLMVLAFPASRATEQAVRLELNEMLEPGQRIDSMQMRVGNRKFSLKSHLGRRPTKRQIALRDALLTFLPGQTEESL